MDHSRRAQQVARIVAEAPVSARRTLSRSFAGEASPRAAIKAACLACCGFERAQVTRCTGYSCPLWMYRPYQDDR